MRVLEQIAQDNVKREKKRRSNGQDEAEETFTYAPRLKQPFITDESGAFSKKVFSGINTRKNVFDETAVFSIGKEQDDDGNNNYQ